MNISIFGNHGGHTLLGVLPAVVTMTNSLKVRGNPLPWAASPLFPSNPSGVRYLSWGRISPPTHPAHTTMGVSEKTELTDSGSDILRWPLPVASGTGRVLPGLSLPF